MGQLLKKIKTQVNTAAVATFLATLRGKLGYFLFHHLDTLLQKTDSLAQELAAAARLPDKFFDSPPSLFTILLAIEISGSRPTCRSL